VIDGRIIGVSNYHAGEELKIIRNLDGSVSHLDIATYLHTRDPIL
jgi:hypothetical protein